MIDWLKLAEMALERKSAVSYKYKLAVCSSDPLVRLVYEKEFKRYSNIVSYCIERHRRYFLIGV